MNERFDGWFEIVGEGVETYKLGRAQFEGLAEKFSLKLKSVPHITSSKNQMKLFVTLVTNPLVEIHQSTIRGSHFYPV